MLAILGYHKIGVPSPGGWETWYYVPEAEFVRQLTVLQDQGFRVIAAETLQRALDGSEDLPERAALLTFDDGYRSVREVALPWLVRFGYPAVLFVPTAFIGKSNIFDNFAEPMEAICDSDELRDLDRHGVSIQSHGVSHRAFSQILPPEQEEELGESKRILEHGLNKPVTLFAYPYGDTGVDPQQVEELLRNTGYRAACVYDNCLNDWPIREPYRLSRLTMGPDTNLEGLLRRCD
jgi:peptidoglycan/xylan/chitin deacetylase (PgdA/CDA1 family)